MSQSPTAHRGAYLYESSQETEDEWNMGSPGYGSAMHSPQHRRDSSERERRSSIGPMRTSSGTSTKEREKQKRSRVTPEQLVHLEHYFAVDRSPTSARRKDISENLGLPERQTQIWFQNRRAKAKLLDGKQGTEAHPPPEPDILPIIPRSFEVEFQELIRDELPIAVVPCADLSIGTWRRIASTANKHDLVVYSSKRNQCLTWFIHSAGYGFKMDLPFSTIVDTEYKLVSAAAGIASLTLSQPPVFYSECTSASGRQIWKRCGDWTEDRQATKILRHTLVGSASHIGDFLHTLHSTRSAAPASPARRRNLEVVASPTMRIPAPPMASLAPPSLPSHGKEENLLGRVDTAIQHFYDPTGHTSLSNMGYHSPPPHSALSTLSAPFSPLGTQLFPDVNQSPVDYYSYYPQAESLQAVPSYAEQQYVPPNSSQSQHLHHQTSQSFEGMRAMPVPSYPNGYSSNSPFQHQSSSASSAGWPYSAYLSKSTDNAGQH